MRSDLSGKNRMVMRFSEIQFIDVKRRCQYDDFLRVGTPFLLNHFTKQIKYLQTAQEGSHYA